MRQAPPVLLSAAERTELETWVATRRPPDRRAVRAQVILEAAEGRTNGEIARLLGIHPETVTRWRHRFVVNRMEGIRRDAPRSGARTRVPPSLTDRIVRITRDEPPPDGVRWTTRSLARMLNVNHMLVHRVWKAHGLAPSRPDPPAGVLPGEPRVDVLGVFLDSPAAVVVFVVDQGGPGFDEPATHPRVDPEISGGFLLPGPLGVPAGISGILGRAGDSLPRVADAHRSPAELLVFLRSLEEQTDPSSELTAIFDRPLEFVSDRVGAWLRGHPRFRVRCAPPGGSWTRAVDEWLNEFRAVALHPESFRGVASLAVSTGVASDTPAPRKQFSWTFEDGLRPISGESEPTARTRPGGPRLPRPSLPRG